METSGERIRKCRLAKGFTQGELGELIGLSASAVMRYEKDERVPKLLTFRELASVLGVSEGYLLCQTDNPQIVSDERINLDRLYEITHAIGGKYEISEDGESIKFTRDEQAAQQSIGEALQRHMETILKICASGVSPSSVPGRIAIATKIIESTKWLIDGFAGSCKDSAETCEAQETTPYVIVSYKGDLPSIDLKSSDKNAPAVIDREK